MGLSEGDGYRWERSVSYLESFPKKLRHTQRTFWSISRLWFADKVHLESCKCEGCFLGDLQPELRL